MRKRKDLFSKIISFLLAVLMTIQSIGIISVYGLEDNYEIIVGGQENEEEEQEIQEEIQEETEESIEAAEEEGPVQELSDAEEEEIEVPKAELPELKAAYRNFVLETEGMSNEAVSLANSDDTYTSLNEEEKELLLMEVSVREDTMTELGRYGFDVRESIPKARLMQILNLNVMQALETIENHNGEGNALTEAVRLRDMIAETPILLMNEEVLTELLMEGYTTDELISAIIMSYIMDAEVEDIISKQSYRVQELRIPEFVTELKELSNEEEIEADIEDSEEYIEESSDEDVEKEETEEAHEETEDDEIEERGVETQETDSEDAVITSVYTGIGSSFVKIGELDFDIESPYEEDDNFDKETAEDSGEDSENETEEELIDTDKNMEGDIDDSHKLNNWVHSEEEKAVDLDSPETTSFAMSNADINEILKISKEYKVDAQMLLDIAAENHIEPELLWTNYREVQSMLGLYRSTDIVPYASSNGILTRDMPSAPFDYSVNHSEIININTGSVIYTDNIVSLSGRGGLDLNLSLIYDSNNSSDDLFYGLKEKIWIAARIRIGNNDYYEWYDEKQELTMNHNEGGKMMYSPFNTRYIAAGWKLNTTRIEFTENFYKTHRYLKLATGGSYLIESDLSLKNYELDNLKLERDTYATYPDSTYVLSYADGTKEYLSSSGALVATRDKYGNAITYVDKSKSEIEITDTMGRKITITLGTQMKVTLPDYTVITYTTPTVSGGLYKQLTSKTDQMGNTTRFNYDIKEGDFDFFHHRSMSRYVFDRYVYHRLTGTGNMPPAGWLLTSPFQILVMNNKVGMVQSSYNSYLSDYNVHAEVYTDFNKVNYHLLTSVVYPSGLMSCTYKYEKVMGKSGIGFVEYYALTKREEVDGSESGISNTKNYSYGETLSSTNFEPNYTGYDLGPKEIELPEGHQYRVFEKTSHGYTEYIYNHKHLKVGEYYYTNDNKYISSVRYEYNDNNLPTEIIKSVMASGGTMTTTEQYSYDKYGNVTYYWNSQADGSKDSEFRTAYTYDSTYNMLTGKTYKTDGKTTVREEYILTSNKKSVQSYRVYENNALKKRVDYTYDNYGNVASVREYVSNTESIMQTITYSNGVYPQTITKGGVSTKFTYDTMGNVKSTTYGNGNATKFEYDKIYRETSITYADGSMEKASYDDKRNITTVTDALGNKTEYQYTPFGTISQIVIPETKEILNKFQYGEYGELTHETDALGNTTIYTYDQLLRPISEKKGTYIKTTEYIDVWVKNTAKIITTEQGSGDAPAIKTVVYINKHGYKTAESRFLGNEEIKKTYENDYIGRVVSELNPQHGKEGLAATNRYTYDVSGNVVKSVNALNETTQYEYDMAGRQIAVTDPKRNTFSYVYDDNNNLIEVKSPFNEQHKSIKTYTYDKNNNMLSETKQTNRPGETKAEKTVYYEYDNRNRLIKTTSGGEYTIYEYDAKGNMLKLITGNGTQITAYEYDRFGNLSVLTDAEGNREKYEYDLKNNLIQKTDRNSSVIKHTYDMFNRIIKTEGFTVSGKTAEFMAYAYSTNGMLLSEENESVKTVYVYDSLGRVIKASDSTGTEKEYGYDLNNNRISLKVTVNDKVIYNVGYEYDKLDRMAKMSRDGKTEAVYTYDKNGNRASLTYGNGITALYSYNDANLVTKLVNTEEGKVLSGYEYTYYLDGNQATKTDNEGKVTAYAYDELNRLASEKEVLGGNSVIRNYEYDNAGNRVLMQLNENGEITRTTYTYDKNNRLLREEIKESGTLNQTVHAYVYDGNGNQTMKLVSVMKFNDGIGTPRLRIHLLTDDGTMAGKYSYLEPELRGAYTDNTVSEPPVLKIALLDGIVNTDSRIEVYTYDVFNRLALVQTPGVKAKYEYKADGLRVSKNVNGDIARHIWDDFYILADTDSDYKDFDIYNRGLGLISSESHGYYIYNAHGDVVQLADKEGDLVKEYSYDAFGVEKEIDEGDGNPFRYCGEYYDKETGTVYLRARHYNPKTGRFLTEDGIRDGLNWYTYANGNPIRYTDPSGYSAYKAHQGDNNTYLPIPGTPKDWLGSLGFPEVVEKALRERIWEVINGMEPKSLSDLFLEFPATDALLGTKDGLTLGELIEVEKHLWGSIIQFFEGAPDNWSNPNTLEDHYDRHGAEVGATSAADYAEKAHELYENRGELNVKIDSDGTIRVYDSAANLFGSYTSDGKTKTYFKPSAGSGYFDRQPGR